MNFFSLSVIALFFAAASQELFHGNYVKALFYLFSGAINIVVIYM